MSDFLAEMEARRDRAPKPGSPIAAVVMAFAAVVVAPFVLTALTVEAAAKVAGGVADTGQIITYAATVVGLAVAVAVVLWAGVYFGLIRKARPGWGLPFLGGLVLASVLLIGGASVYAGVQADREAQEEIAAEEVRQTLETFLRDSLKAEFKSTKVKAHGKYGDLERLLKADMAEAMRLSNAYEDEIAALKLDEAPERPAAAQLRDYEARFGKAKALTVTYRAALKKRLISARTRFEREAFNPGVRRNYLPRFEQQFRLKQGSLDRALDLEEERFDLSREQMKILADSYGQWTLDGRMVMFRRVVDMKAFNDVTSRMRYIRWRLDAEAVEEAQQYRDFQKQVDEAGVRP